MEDAVRRALTRSGEVRGATAGLEVARSRVSQAEAGRYPQIELKALTGPSPPARGNQGSSPDSTSDPHITGIFGRADFTITQPLYTFGRLTALEAAAREGVAAGEAGVRERQVATVLRWNFDFGLTAGRVREAQAERDRLEALRETAEGGIPLEIRRLHRELTEARAAISKTEGSSRSARRWLVAAGANFDLGIGEAKEVADALGAYAKAQADHLRALYNEKAALAGLEAAAGRASTGRR